MKSVVVEASTVAKAIELAWQKAEKPEEFFIRILQEHSSGFLGFGAQKAKIVFFFKNSQKSDSLFPVVLKQKEYANLFDNDKLKAPSQLNVVDNDLNKNISLGQKKKQHPAQQQAKQKQNQPSHHAPRPAHQDVKPQHQNQAAPMKHPQQVKPQLHTNKTQVKLELPAKPVVKQEQIVTKEVIEKKIQVQVSRTQETSKIVQIPKAVAPFLQKVTQVAAPQAPVAQVNSAPVVQVAAPRVIPKMKRRPLTGADQGVSGITRSTNSSLGKASGITPKVVKDSLVASAPAQVVAKNVEEDKGNQE